jgi:CRISPR/Cas system-associated endonuclease Cas1
MDRSFLTVLHCEHQVNSVDWHFLCKAYEKEFDNNYRTLDVSKIEKGKVYMIVQIDAKRQRIWELNHKQTKDTNDGLHMTCTASQEPSKNYCSWLEGVQSIKEIEGRLQAEYYRKAPQAPIQRKSQR